MIEKFNNMAGIDYSSVDINIAQEIIRLAELKLKAQMKIGLASNQRAATFCQMFFVATLSTLGGIVIAMENNCSMATQIAGFIAMSMFSYSTYMCAFALWPVKFSTVGTQPKNWLSEDVLKGNLVDTLLHEAENYDAKISDNSKVNEICAKYLKTGVLYGLYAPAIALIVWFVVSIGSA